MLDKHQQEDRYLWRLYIDIWYVIASACFMVAIFPVYWKNHSMLVPVTIETFIVYLKTHIMPVPVYYEMFIGIAVIFLISCCMLCHAQWKEAESCQ